MYLGIDVSVQAYDNMKREGNYNGSYDETFVTFRCGPVPSDMTSTPTERQVGQPTRPAISTCPRHQTWSLCTSPNDVIRESEVGTIVSANKE